jgi:hypothetical protein
MATMLIRRDADYAMRTLAHLALAGGERLVPTEALADPVPADAYRSYPQVRRGKRRANRLLAPSLDRGHRDNRELF